MKYTLQLGSKRHRRPSIGPSVRWETLDQGNQAPGGKTPQKRQTPLTSTIAVTIRSIAVGDSDRQKFLGVDRQAIGAIC